MNPSVPVRDEDAFPVEAVADWLAEHAGLAGKPAVTQFPGGVSNLTYLLRYPDRELILRRPPSGSKARGAHDMRREYDVQRLLRPAFPYVAQMVAFCDDETVIGSQFYVMTRLDGRILRRDLPPDLTLSPSQAAALCRVMIDRLVDLHRVDTAATGLDRFGRGPGYVQRQVDGWSHRYRQARTENVGSCEAVMRWLAENQPADRPHCFIHNDYRLDNIVLDPHDPLRVTGVLDWELSTVGDPLMELGGSMAYWMQADDDPAFLALRRQPSNLPGMLTRAEIVAYYAEQTGTSIDADQWLFYEVFGLFRLAVIAQQVYYRYHHGQTHNPAFADMHLLVTTLERRAEELLRGSA